VIAPRYGPVGSTAPDADTVNVVFPEPDVGETLNQFPDELAAAVQSSVPLPLFAMPRVWFGGLVPAVAVLKYSAFVVTLIAGETVLIVRLTGTVNGELITSGEVIVTDPV